MLPVQSNQCTQITVGDDLLTLWGYRTNRYKLALMWLVSIATCGLFRLLLYWFPKFYVYCTCTRCSLTTANRVMIRDEHMNVAFRPVQIVKSDSEKRVAVLAPGFQLAEVDSIRYFTYKKIKHIWIPQELRFISVEMTGSEVFLSRFHELANNGLTDDEVSKRTLLFGLNVIDVKLTPVLVLLFKEAISPFYIFQIFSVIVWFSDSYEIYAGVIVVMSLISVFMDVFQTRRQEKNLRSMVQSSDSISVVRNFGNVSLVGTDELVPGDVILIPPHGCIMHCDAVLLNGTAIVNESMLTGESVPVTKTALPDLDDDSVFNLKEHSRNTLFCGTQVLQTRYYAGKHVKAVVLRTAYTTLKGQLVRSIMYPKPVDFSFTKDLFKFVFIMSLIAACGFAYTITVMNIRGANVQKIILRALDIITIVVPPALPAAMSIGIFAAQRRLQQQKIYCISPSTINTCGAVNCVCFDKTGTLTEDGLNFHSARPVIQNLHEGPMFDVESSVLQDDFMKLHWRLVEAMASCHTLTRIHGKICGDPLDLILFDRTKWILDEIENSGIAETARFDILQPTVVKSPLGFLDSETIVELAILRQFPFSSSQQRMTVIVHNPEDSSHEMVVFCKGAPEKVASLCAVTTIPPDYYGIVNDYTQHGYRLIAVAYKKIFLSFAKTQKVKRENVEVDMELLGLVALDNRLKPQTVGVIHQLNKAQIRTVMITGDNILTALSVARECGVMHSKRRAYILEADTEKCGEYKTPLILKQSASSAPDDFLDETCSTQTETNSFIEPSYQLAISGPTFEILCHEYPEMLPRFVTVCDVYARMSPEQKQILINKLQEVDYTVAMCGDGANDCAALKAAHAGISLSEAEASIAAPFTSRIPDIRCVSMIILEGRAALVTSFGLVKYMAGYSFTQFVTILQLYWLSTNLTDFQFLYIDLCLVTLVAVFFGNTRASSKLCARPPPTKLLSVCSIVSIIGQLLIVFVFQFFVFTFTTTQPWFYPNLISNDETSETTSSFQGTALFCLSTFQYLSLAIIYSKGYPYRSSIFSNIPLCSIIVILTMLSAWMTVYPLDFMNRIMEFEPIPDFGYRVFILILGLNSALCGYFFEMFVIDHLIPALRNRWMKKSRAAKSGASLNCHEKHLLSVGKNPSWIDAEFALNGFPACASSSTCTKLSSENGAASLIS